VKVIRRVIGVNEVGARVGESHHNAKLTDAEVDMLLQLREEGWGYRRLAAMFDVSKRTVRGYCAGQRRCQVPARWKVIERPEQ